MTRQRIAVSGVSAEHAIAYAGELTSVRPCHDPDGLTSIYRTEGISGLYRGTSLALFGVSNGAIQFMAYEEMKRWGFERKKRQFAKEGREYTPQDDKLVSRNILS